MPLAAGIFGLFYYARAGLGPGPSLAGFRAWAMHLTRTVTARQADSEYPTASRCIFSNLIRYEIREAAPRLRLVGAFPPRKHTTVTFTA
jgi:hypothetical protein